MGDMAEIMNAMKAHNKVASAEKRAVNRESSAEILKQHGVSFITNNDGVHLIVTHDGNTVDFWPGTGLWVFRNGSKEGRGVFGMLRKLGVQVTQQARGTQ